MNGCGRIRKPLGKGWTSLIETELRDLRVGTILLDAGESITIETGTREMAFVLVRGDADARLPGGIEARLGERGCCLLVFSCPYLDLLETDSQ